MRQVLLLMVEIVLAQPQPHELVQILLHLTLSVQELTLIVLFELPMHLQMRVIF